MSELSENVTGEWIKATAAFGHTPSRIPVQMYVEGDDDVEFWKEAVKPYQVKYDIRVVTNKAVNPEEGNGKTVLLSMDGLCNVKVVAVDADFDLIIDEYSQYTNMVRISPYVVNTTWYSVENILLQKTGYLSLIEQYSEASWDLFAYFLATVVAKIETRPIRRYGEMMSQYGVQKCAAKSDFTEFVAAYSVDLKDAIDLYKDASDLIKVNIRQSGYGTHDVWKLTRGHYLWDMIVKPQLENDIKNKIDLGVQAQCKAGDPVDRVRVMNDLGITKSIKDHVNDDFYYGDMSNVNVPTETRNKLDAMFS